jgi:cytosine deaminase
MLNAAVLHHDRYWLINAHCPVTLLPAHWPDGGDRTGLVPVNLCLADGQLVAVQPAALTPADTLPRVDLQGRLVLPGFVDSHTHLDKGHIWERSPNPDGTFTGALHATRADAAAHWHHDDVRRRMEFGLRCSEAHGTTAIRTHIDCGNGQAKISLPIAAQLREEWRDRITLQIVSLLTLNDFLTPAGVAVADQIADLGAVLGAVTYPHPNLDQQLDTFFQLAADRQIEQLDFHADETKDPTSMSLRHLAQAALRHSFQGQILCGHCCSLAMQAPEEVDITLNLVREAGIELVSLPMCNLFLQDRRTDGTTPRWRGVTLAHEARRAGISLSFASDNCRDPFYGFGDHDMLEVWTQSVRIAHLDYPYGDWIQTVNDQPSRSMGLGHNRLEPGRSADLVIFPARYYSELLARSQHDRLVLRHGKPSDRTLPDYAELDDLVLP